MPKPKAKTILLAEQVAKILEVDLLDNGFVFDDKISAYTRKTDAFTEQIIINSHRKPGSSLSLTFTLGIRHSEVEEIFWTIDQLEPWTYFNLLNKRDRDYQLKHSSTMSHYCLNANWQWYIDDDQSLTEIEPRIHKFANDYALPWLSSRMALKQILAHLGDRFSNNHETGCREARALIICYLLNDRQSASQIIKEELLSPNGYWKSKFLEFFEKAKNCYPWFRSIEIPETNLAAQDG
jgi:hypothetical protein